MRFIPLISSCCYVMNISTLEIWNTLLPRLLTYFTLVTLRLLQFQSSILSNRQRINIEFSEKI